MRFIIQNLFDDVLGVEMAIERLTGQPAGGG